MIKRVVLALCVLFLTSVGSLSAQTLKVGLSDADYPPFYFVSDNELQGAAVEIAEHLAHELGFSLEYHRYPWKRVQHNLKTGEIDMVLLYFKTEERGRDVFYTDEPHLIERAALFGPSHLKLSFDGDLTALKQYEFYGIRGYYYGEQYARADFLAKYEVKNEPALIRWVSSSQRDFIGIGNPPAIEFYAKNLGLSEKIHFYTPALYEGKNYFAFSKARADSEQIAKHFTQQLLRYKQTEGYKKVLKHYQIKP